MMRLLLGVENGGVSLLYSCTATVLCGSDLHRFYFERQTSIFILLLLLDILLDSDTLISTIHTRKQKLNSKIFQYYDL